MFYPEHLEEYH